MKLEDQVCSLELAKRLKELGVKQSGYFGWSEYEEFDTPSRKKIRGNWVLVSRFGSMSIDSCSAFTDAELGELLPHYCVSGKLKRPRDGGAFTCQTVRGKMDLKAWVDQYPSPLHFWGKTEADARAKMLIHLIEKGIVKPGGGVG